VALLARFDSSFPVSVYTLIAAGVTVVAAVLARETAGQKLRAAEKVNS
jgi:hypothetical protein